MKTELVTKKIDLNNISIYHYIFIMLSNNEQIKTIANQIYDIECPTLDIGTRVGSTGYIDFINSNEFIESVRKGVDINGRKFIAFRANIEYSNGQNIETFTTIFQRYYNDENLWMGAGKQTHLFATYGGINIFQLHLLYKLLTEKTVMVTEDMINTCSLEDMVNTYRIGQYNYDNEKTLHYPVKITLVEKKNTEKERIEDIMKDLEEKVNPKSVKEGLQTLVNAIKTNDPSVILNPIKDGVKEFEERAGRPMTYGEMRAMWG
jgi:hypothetical protein